MNYRYFLSILALLFACETRPTASQPNLAALAPVAPASTVTTATKPAAHTRQEAKAAEAVALSVPSAQAPTPGGLSEVETTGMPPLPLGLFTFVISDEGGYHLVLREEVEAQWIGGPPRTLSSGDPLVVQREVNVSQLPPELAAWQNQRVDLYSIAGPLCETTITGFSLLGRLGYAWFEERPTKTDPAIDLWSQSKENGQQLLVANIAIPEEECPGASWARLSALPEPQIIEAFPVGGDFAEKAVKAFRKLPAYKKIQAEYQSLLNAMGEFNEKSLWDEMEGSYPEVWIMRTDLGPTLVWISAETGVFDCDGPMFRLKAAFTTGSDLTHPRFSLLGVLHPEDALSFIGPYAAINLEGGSNWAFLGEGELLHRQGKLYRDWAYLEDPTIPPDGYCF